MLGYDNLERFRTADDRSIDDDYACLPLSSEQLDRVLLLLLEERDPAAWLLTKEGHGPPTAQSPILKATEAPSSSILLLTDSTLLLLPDELVDRTTGCMCHLLR